MKLKSYLSGLLCLPRCPWSRESVSSPKRFLCTALTSVFFLKDYCGESKLKFGIVGCGKGFPKCSLILFVNVNHTLHHLNHRLIFFRIEVAEIPFHYLSAWLPNHTIIIRRFGQLLSSKSCLHSYVWLI